MSGLISMFRKEWEFLESKHKFLKARLICGLLLAFLPWILGLLTPLNEGWYLISALGNYIITISVAEYALLRGRSEYWGFLGVIGLLVVMLQGDATKKPKKVTRMKRAYFDYLLAGLLGTTLFFWARFGAYYQLLGPGEFKDSFASLAGNVWLGPIALALLFVLPVYSLVTNRRVIFGLSGWWFLLVVFITLLSKTNGVTELNYGSENDLVRIYMGYRNMFYLFIGLYLPLHFLIHGLSNLSSERKLLTVKGVMDVQLQLLTMTFLYALVDLVV